MVAFSAADRRPEASTETQGPLSMNLLRSLIFILRHPLNRRHPGAALARWLRWQLGCRLLPGPAVVPFVNGLCLIVQRGMTGATGNVYCGLHEFEDMALVLHA